MPASLEAQAVPGMREIPKSRRFSCSDEESISNKNAGDIETTDNTEKDVQNSDDRNFVRKREDAGDKNVSETARKTSNEKVRDSQEIKENPENEKVNTCTDFIMNDLFGNTTIQDGQAENAVALYVSEKANSEISRTIKSFQIEALNEIKQNRLDIETALSVKSNLRDGLKQVLMQANEDKAEIVIPEKQIPKENTEQPVDWKDAQIKLQALVDKTGIACKTGNEDIQNILSGQKKTLTETPLDTKDEKGGSDFNSVKEEQQVFQVNKSDVQKISDTDEKQNEKNTSFDTVISEVTKEGKELFNDMTGNSGQTVKNMPDIAEVAIHDVKSKDKNTDFLENNKIDIEQVFSGTSVSTAGKSDSIASAKASPDILRENLDTDISARISRQITESIHSSVMRQGDERQITVRLNPPELGSVVIKFSEQDSQLTGILEVSKSETKIEIERVLPDIIRSLSDNGIQLRKVDVVSSDSSHADYDMLKEQFRGDNSSDQNSPSSRHAGAGDFNKAEFRKWFSNTIEYHRNYGFKNQYTGAGSINMLL